MIGEANDLVDTISLVLIVVLMFPLAIAAFRMIAAATTIDRVVALDMLTGIAVSLAALVAATTDRREFLDVGFGLALISFVGVVAFSGFIEKKGRGRK